MFDSTDMEAIPMKKITEKQERILKYISSYTAEQGYPPSVR